MNRIKVMMSSYNGEKYIEEQINSILAQVDVSIELYIRDDGSTDKTTSILVRLASANSRIHVTFGSNIGANRSFMELLYTKEKTEQYDYFAFSDQDDIWEKDKLKRAVCILRNEKKPALYYSALLAFREDTGEQKIVKNDREYTFAETFFQSHYPGCTMVMNKSGMNFIHSIRRPDITIMHDIFLAQVFMGTGNRIIYDRESKINYRIHGNNVSVKKNSIIGEFMRYRMILNKQKGLRLSSANAYRRVMSDLIEIGKLNILESITSYKKSLRNRWKLVKMIGHTRFNVKIKSMYIFAVIIGFY